MVEEKKGGKESNKIEQNKNVKGQLLWEFR